MNEWLKKLLTQVKDLWAKGSLVQKVIFIGIILLVIGAIILILTLSSTPTSVALYNVAITDEAARDKILYRLSEENIPVSVNAAGMLTVPDEATARKARTILVREDLTPSNVSPWNLFDTERWTTTDFERNVNLLRSITAQVTQHIESLEEVDRANVVIRMPERTLFAADQNPATASVIIYQRPGSDILTNKKKIQGIQKLLMFAVEGLKEENISIADSTGTILNDFEGMEDIERVDVVAKEQKLIATLETQYRAKVLTALQQIFGADRVRDLNIKIDMDMSKRLVSATEYSPITIKSDNPDTPYDDSQLVESITLSSETVTKKWTGTGYNPEGPAGADGNTPPVYSDMSNLYGLSEESGVKKNEVINTKQIQEEKSPTIDRVTVSVNIDGTWRKKYDEKGQIIFLPNGAIDREYIPIDPAILTNAQSLVQDAIGYNRTRGDSVSVQNIQFDRTAQFEAEDAAFLRAQQTRRTVFYVLTGIVAVLLAFMIFRVISREIEKRRRLREEELLRKHRMEREKILWESEQAGMEVTMSVEERKRAELQENAIAMAKDHPEDVAMLIRTWLMEE
ncbi:MAG TPA: flagellar basal-body MS-ring/collar protein FliF [Treponemataceae bacterium]|nr:flagellar basal-body MS-ring/collar protein FliF [Treponemataceae bacterium]